MLRDDPVTKPRATLVGSIIQARGDLYDAPARIVVYSVGVVQRSGSRGSIHTRSRAASFRVMAIGISQSFAIIRGQMHLRSKHSMKWDFGLDRVPHTSERLFDHSLRYP
jgi:hypothetical protein